MNQCSYQNLNSAIRQICVWILHLFKKVNRGCSLCDNWQNKASDKKPRFNFLYRSNYRLWRQCVTSTAGAAHFLSATLDQRTGRIDARVRKKGQEELSLFMSTLDTICTRDVPLGLRSHITSTVCSPEMSHFLKLTREPLQSLAPLSTISLSLAPKDRPSFFAIMFLV